MTRLEHIRKSFKSIQEKTKIFFQGEKWKEILVFSFFVLLSFGFWLLQSLRQEYEITLTFPIRYTNVPADIALDSNTPQTITAEIKDKGSILLNYTWGRTLIPIEVDFENTKREKGLISVSKDAIETDIQKQLFSTTNLQNFEPQQIDVKYSRQEKKEIPVTFNGNIQLKTGFQLSGEINLSPFKITAYAAHSLLDTLKEIKTVYTEFRNADKNITQTIQLIKMEGVNLVPETVSVTIPIEEYTEKTLEIPISYSHIPANYTIRTFPSVVKVTCSVPLSRFKELSENMFEILVPYKTLEHNVSGSFPIKLTKKPDWVHTTILSPKNAEFILEYNGE